MCRSNDRILGRVGMPNDRISGSVSMPNDWILGRVGVPNDLVPSTYKVPFRPKCFGRVFSFLLQPRDQQTIRKAEREGRGKSPVAAWTPLQPVTAAVWLGVDCRLAKPEKR